MLIVLSKSYSDSRPATSKTTSAVYARSAPQPLRDRPSGKPVYKPLERTVSNHRSALLSGPRKTATGRSNKSPSPELEQIDLRDEDDPLGTDEEDEEDEAQPKVPSVTVS